MPIRKHEVLIKHTTETIVVPVGGGRRTILEVKGRAGKLQQITYRTTQLPTRLIIRVDNEYDIEFPTATSIITSHTFTRPYAPETIFSSKGAASPYSITSTVGIEFDESIELIILNETSTAATITETFLVAKLFTKEYEKEKAWF